MEDEICSGRSGDVLWEMRCVVGDGVMYSGRYGYVLWEMRRSLVGIGVMCGGRWGDVW